jgi:uncharacterized protein involved in exopolysaccharide biosynthesis
MTGSVRGREWTPRERLRAACEVVGKRRGLITRTAVLLLFAIAVVTWLVTPTYRAQSSLYVRLEQDPTDPTAPPALPRATRLGGVSPLAVLNSYVETLLSRTTAEQIVREFKLDRLPPPSTPRDRVKGWVKDRLGGLLRAIFRRGNHRAGKGDDRFRKTVDKLRASVAADIDQDTELVLLTVRHRDPRLAQQINARMLQILVDRSLRMSRADTEAAYRAALASLPAAEARLKGADDALTRFKQQHGIVDLSDEQRVRIQRLDAMEFQHAQAESDLEEAKARVEVLRKEFESRRQPVTLVTTIQDNPQVLQVKADLYAKEERLAGLLQTYTDEHPDVVRLQSEIAAAQNRLRGEVARVVASETKGLAPEYATLVQDLIDVESTEMGLTAKERASGQALARFRVRLSRLPATERQLGDLTREQTVAEDFYTNLNRRVQELQNASLNALPPVSMSVVDPPRLPKGLKDIGSPPYLVILILAPILSVLLALTVAFVCEYFDDALGSEQEVADALALPVLAAVPYIRRPRRSRSAKLGEG